MLLLLPAQVMQLTWTGQTQHMASVAANPPPLLAGALADSLLLVRANTSTGEPEVSTLNGIQRSHCCCPAARRQKCAHYFGVCELLILFVKSPHTISGYHTCTVGMSF
jgi:hypothetical protein